MFCPQCGQQQASDATRFCSRCGFQLESVAGLLVTGGVPLVNVTQGGEPTLESPRHKGVRLGGKLMLFGIFLGPALVMLHELIRTPEELSLIGAMIFMAGLLRLIYALIFEDGPFRRAKPQPQAYTPPAPKQFTTPRQAASLPPQQGVPARGYVAPRSDTAEIMYRPSVTEGTTRLLDEERDEPAR
ncbi:MAG: hypothetical protein QOH51_2679 [Acidobacteriota bacterium]|jgi:hypothetical protein|nr:hypothetical protein [Acidobacteriota bacterium]